MLFCLSLSACCLVLFSIITIHLFLLCILFSIVVVCCFCCFGILFFSLETYQKTSRKEMETPKTAKMKNAEKKNGHFDKSN